MSKHLISLRLSNKVAVDVLEAIDTTFPLNVPKDINHNNRKLAIHWISRGGEVIDSISTQDNREYKGKKIWLSVSRPA